MNARALAAETCENCKAAQAEHHKVMGARAMGRGWAVAAPRYDACDQLQAKGVLK